MIDWYSGVIFFVIGASIGSFLNVCIARWPLEQSIIRPPSRCPHCETPIKWYDNVPILAWVWVRGKCRSCGRAISVVYPAVELAVALGWLVCALTWGPSLTAVRVAVFGTIMLGISITDAKHYVIPDGFTVFGLFFVAAVLAAVDLKTNVRHLSAAPYAEVFFHANTCNIWVFIAS